jgi:hypothetical protein
MNWTWIAICATWGLLSTAMGFSWDSWQFWSLFGLLFASKTCGKMQGEDDTLTAIEAELEKVKKGQE